MTIIKLEVKGVHCQSCEILISEVLEEKHVEIRKFDVNLKQQIATLELHSTLPTQKVIDAVNSCGDYTIQVIK